MAEEPDFKNLYGFWFSWYAMLGEGTRQSIIDAAFADFEIRQTNTVRRH